jgi:hypothetical protein
MLPLDWASEEKEFRVPQKPKPPRWLYACVGVVLGAVASVSFGEELRKSKEEQALEVHEKKSRAGVRIAPPPGAPDTSAVQKSAEKLLKEGTGGWENGDVSYPVLDLGMSGEGADPEAGEKNDRKNFERRRKESTLKSLDSELSGGRKSMDERHTKELSDVERRLGLEPEDESIGKLPSFTLGVQKIKELFRAREFEEALLELSELLRHYPKSPQLLLMKGTLHQRLGQLDLSLAAYEKAFEWEPSRKLKAQIDSLKRRIEERESLRPKREGIVIPEGVEDAQFVIPPKSAGEKP